MATPDELLAHAQRLRERGEPYYYSDIDSAVVGLEAAAKTIRELRRTMDDYKALHQTFGCTYEQENTRLESQLWRMQEERDAEIARLREAIPYESGEELTAIVDRLHARVAALEGAVRDLLEQIILEENWQDREKIAEARRVLEGKPDAD